MGVMMGDKEERGRDAAATPIRAKIRRLYLPDVYYFITCVLANRMPILGEERHMTLFRETLREVKKLHPFIMKAYAFLPDHFHLLIFVPESTSISTLLKSVKWNFTLNYKKAVGVNGRVKLWQRGFWDHVIRDERDYMNHFDYIHYNPVKHGLVNCPIEYPHTSFHAYVERGWYEADWGCTEPEGIRHLDYE
jgi:putative transposase